MRVHRLTLARDVDTAFSGEGARRVGGRWTPVGYPAVFTASSIALAVLETLVHTDPRVLPSHQCIAVDVPDSIEIDDVDEARLPADWRDTPASAVLQAIGGEWLDAARTVLLRVPSVVVPQESNYVINPIHPDFSTLIRHAPEPFTMDARLFDRRSS